MAPASFLTLSVTILVVALTPGPVVAAIVARAIADGLRPALAINMGVITGDLLFFSLAAAGMAAAASSLGPLFQALRIAAAAYLVWQGVQMWRTAPRVASAATAHEAQFRRNYGAGLMLMMGHVQAMLFYAALLPGFVRFDSLAPRDLMLIGAMLVIVIGGVNAGYAAMAARARRFFMDESALRTLNRLAATLMFVAAAVVASR